MFSEMVDNVAKRTGRPSPADQLNIIAYIRATLRELHSEALFDRDRYETQIIPTSLPAIWTYPADLRTLEAVSYSRTIWPKLLLPGEKIRGERHYFYPAADYYVFVGSFLNSPISLSYFTRPPVFQYYAVGLRPAIYDEETETWTYLTDPGPPAVYENTTGDPLQDEIARNKVSEWMLINWKHVVEEGAITKTFKQFDDQRSRASFSLFQTFKSNLLRDEGQKTKVPDGQL